MNWFLYDKDLRHERVSGLILTLKISIINNQKPSPGGGGGVVGNRLFKKYAKLTAEHLRQNKKETLVQLFSCEF